MATDQPKKPRKRTPKRGTQDSKVIEFQAQPNAEPNPFDQALKASKGAYDSTRSSNAEPKSLKATRTPKREQEASTSLPNPQSPATNTVSPQGDPLGVAWGNPTGAPISATLPPFRVRGILETPSQYVKSLPAEILCAWASAFIATGKRQEWLFRVAPHFGRENNRYRADIVREIESQELVQQELMRLKQEEVLSDLQRRRMLRQIAESPEHPMKGFADNLKAIELDARHDPESMLCKSAQSERGTQSLPPINLFALPAGAVIQIPSAQPKQVEPLDA